jgi:FOG: PKD repeat
LAASSQCVDGQLTLTETRITTNESIKVNPSIYGDRNFGDGTNSTEQNPTHTCSAAGNYTVTLTASNANGTDTKISEINILSFSHNAPCGFNFLIFLMVAFYLCKKSI